MKVAPLIAQEIPDLLEGTAILGTGGGGEREWAEVMLDLLKEEAKQIEIVDPRDVPAGSIVVGVASIGGGVEKATRDRLVNRFGKLPDADEFFVQSIRLAEQTLARCLGKDIAAVYPFEIGCGNTILAAAMAALSDKPVINGDCNGRAVPEIELCTLNIMRIPFCPMVIITPWLETIVIENVRDYSRAEEICRSLSIAAGGSCLAVGSAVSGEQFRSCVTANTISKAIDLGRTLRKARCEAKDPVHAALRQLNGYLLFRGKVTSFSRATRGGFFWGEHRLTGTQDFAGRKLRIWYKNENLVSFLDGKPYVCGPDLLCVLDSSTGEGLYNREADITVDRNVSVIGIKASELWRTRRGLEIFNPRHFDFDFDYAPVESFFQR